MHSDIYNNAPIGPNSEHAAGHYRVNPITAKSGPRCVRAELTGSDGASAEGITVRSASPVFSLCRRLIAAGIDADRPLVAYRGMVACIIINSIGEGALLTVAEGNRGAPRFRRWKPVSRREESPRIARHGRAATHDPKALGGVAS